jgi:hypothetical protein
MEHEGEIREMGRRSFGFGRWTAPYWFLGPEPGQSREEHNDLTRRAEAWRYLGELDLMDCRKFHEQIKRDELSRERPRLQQTWRPLMLLLMTFLGAPSEPNDLRNYQRDRWGALDGDTCVIELSGLSANSFKVERDRKLFREERIGVIRAKMFEYKPKFAVMYGKGNKHDWEAITERPFPSENVLRVGSTIVAFMPHPTSHGSTNKEWIEIGERLRILCA